MKRFNVVVTLAIAALLLFVTWQLIRAAARTEKVTSSATQIAATQPPTSFPTKPGSYAADVWRYDYSVTAPGSRSERRIGRLYDGAEEIAGALGEIRDTPVGRFVFFGSDAQRYNIGWLNTLTYDKPVFGPDGHLLPELRGYFAKPEEP